MTKEYHVHVEKTPTYQMNLVFETERHNDGSLFFTELWIMTTHNDRFVKSRINLESLVQRIAENVGGNVSDENIPDLAEIFKDVLTDEKRVDIQLDLCEKDISKSSNDPIQRLLKAQELSEVLYSGTNGDAQQLIDRVIVKRLNKNE
jgi:hypothetical protein